MASEVGDPPSESGLAAGRRRPPGGEGSAPATIPAGVEGEPASTALLEVTDEEIAAARQARAARNAAKVPSRRRRALSWGLLIGGALLVAVLVRTFAFEQFWIPSPSMSNTLVRNDRVLVNKLAYRVHDVRRGDVVVFERPKTQAGTIKDLIKRVVGLPGEHVSILGGTVRIDGRVLDEPYTDGLQTEANVGCGLGNTKGIDTEAGMRVPDGHVLVLGDNRVNSQDGRCFGPIARGPSWAGPS